MNTLDIVIPYENFIKGRVDSPNLLLDFTEEEEISKMVFYKKVKKEFDLIIIKKFLNYDRPYSLTNGDNYGKNKSSIIIEPSKRRIVFRKKDLPMNYILSIIVPLTVTERNFVVMEVQTIEDNIDFKILKSSLIGYELQIKFSSYDLRNDAFNNDEYLNIIINRLLAWIKEYSKNNQAEIEAGQEFDYMNILMSGHWKNLIKYESDSCIIIEK